MGLIETVKLPIQSDERGWGISLSQSDERCFFPNLHLVSLNPGKVRGNHYHPLGTEYIMAFGGQCRLVAVDEKTGEREERIVSKDERVLFKIPPTIIHAVFNEGDKEAYLLCYYDLKREEEWKSVKRQIT
jgi:dTDP-4-dehydrorhamnose 3,5-epimerase-like enzyme